jgi:predicted MPP superfamily phosphohydrolase
MTRGFIPFPVFILIMSFLYIRLSRGLKPSSGKNIFLIGIFSFCTLMLIVQNFISSGGIPLTIIFYISGFVMGGLVLAPPVFFIETMASFFLPARRKLLVFASLGLLAMLSAVTLVNGMQAPVVREIHISLARLPGELDGFTVVQLSDLHIEETTPVNRLEAVVDKTNALNPHLVVITGDLVGSITGPIDTYVSILSRLRAVNGVLAVTGNHEFGNSGRTFKRLIAGTGIQVLRGEHVTLDNGIQVAGVDDPQGMKGKSEMNAALNAALKGVSAGRLKILLSHRPWVFDLAAAFNIDLQLSGHTHAGQLPPLDWLAHIYYRYPYGIYRKGDACLYTSCGAGTWAYLPMRLFSRNEIVKIILHKNKKDDNKKNTRLL